MAKKELSQVIKAYETIKEEIQCKELLPGVSIVNSNLYERLGMSRTPVREALRRLEMEGLVEIIPQKGAFVKSHTKEELLQAYEVMEGLEGMLAYTIAERFRRGELSLSDTEPLHKMIEQMDGYNKLNDNGSWVQCDIAFHKGLRHLSKNRILVSDIEKYLTQFYYTSHHYLLPSEKKVVSNVEHIAIVRHIEAGEADAARRVSQNQKARMRDFLSQTAERQIAYL